MWYMPREHGERGEFVETVSPDDVLKTFEHVRGPVVLSADVADRLGCSRETARRKLEELYDRGDVDCRKVSRRVIYWRTETGDTTARAAGEADDTDSPTEPSPASDRGPADGSDRPCGNDQPDDAPEVDIDEDRRERRDPRGAG